MVTVTSLERTSYWYRVATRAVLLIILLDCSKYEVVRGKIFEEARAEQTCHMGRAIPTTVLQATLNKVQK